MSRLRKADMRAFDEARKVAEMSDYPGFKIGCVLYYKGHIIGRGCNTNKTNPTQKRYNRYRKFNKSPKPVRHSSHAEVQAVRSVQYTVAQEIDWKKVKCYTYRISPGRTSGHGLSKPCESCEHLLKDLGVREFFYTLDDGYGYMYKE